MDRLIETPNQFGHSRVLVKPSTGKMDDIPPRISQVLARIQHGWKKKCKIAFIIPFLIPDHASTGLIHQNGIPRTADPKLAQTRLDLGRETEKGGRAAPVPDQDPQLIQHFFSSEHLQFNALVRPRNDIAQIVIQELSQPRDPMADSIVQ